METKQHATANGTPYESISNLLGQTSSMLEHIIQRCRCGEYTISTTDKMSILCILRQVSDLFLCVGPRILSKGTESRALEYSKIISKQNTELSVRQNSSYEATEDLDSHSCGKGPLYLPHCNIRFPSADLSSSPPPLSSLPMSLLPSKPVNSSPVSLSQFPFTNPDQLPEVYSYANDHRGEVYASNQVSVAIPSKIHDAYIEIPNPSDNFHSISEGAYISSDRPKQSEVPLNSESFPIISSHSEISDRFENSGESSFPGKNEKIYDGKTTELSRISQIQPLPFDEDKNRTKGCAAEGSKVSLHMHSRKPESYNSALTNIHSDPVSPIVPPLSIQTQVFPEESPPVIQFFPKEAEKKQSNNTVTEISYGINGKNKSTNIGVPFSDGGLMPKLVNSSSSLTPSGLPLTPFTDYGVSYHKSQTKNGPYGSSLTSSSENMRYLASPLASDSPRIERSANGSWLISAFQSGENSSATIFSPRISANINNICENGGSFPSTIIQTPQKITTETPSPILSPISHPSAATGVQPQLISLDTFSNSAHMQVDPACFTSSLNGTTAHSTHDSPSFTESKDALPGLVGSDDTFLNVSYSPLSNTVSEWHLASKAKFQNGEGRNTLSENTSSTPTSNNTIDLQADSLNSHMGPSDIGTQPYDPDELGEVHSSVAHLTGYSRGNTSLCNNRSNFSVSKKDRRRKRRDSHLSDEPHLIIFAFVEFKRQRVCKYPCSEQITPGQYVIVDGDRGMDCGLLVQTTTQSNNGEINVHCMDGTVVSHTRMKVAEGEVKRIATIAEVERLHNEIAKAESQALTFCREQCEEMRLNIAIVDCEYQFDMRKISFFFDADRSVDFRELVRELFRHFGSRIWMQNIHPMVKNVMPGREDDEV